MKDKRKKRLLVLALSTALGMSTGSLLAQQNGIFNCPMGRVCYDVSASSQADLNKQVKALKTQAGVTNGPRLIRLIAKGENILDITVPELEDIGVDKSTTIGISGPNITLAQPAATLLRDKGATIALRDAEAPVYTTAIEARLRGVYEVDTGAEVNAVRDGFQWLKTRSSGKNVSAMAFSGARVGAVADDILETGVRFDSLGLLVVNGSELTRETGKALGATAGNTKNLGVYVAPGAKIPDTFTTGFREGLRSVKGASLASTFGFYGIDTVETREVFENYASLYNGAGRLTLGANTLSANDAAEIGKRNVVFRLSNIPEAAIGDWYGLITQGKIAGVSGVVNTGGAGKLPLMKTLLGNKAATAYLPLDSGQAFVALARDRATRDAMINDLNKDEKTGFIINLDSGKTGYIVQNLSSKNLETLGNQTTAPGKTVTDRQQALRNAAPFVDRPWTADETGVRLLTTRVPVATGQNSVSLGQGQE